MTIKDSSQIILKSAKHFLSGTMISRCTGLIREIAMAAVFGTTPAIAAFWMAFRFAYLLRRLFGEGCLHTVFVPHFEALRKENAAIGARFFYDLSMGIAFFILLITMLTESVLGGLLLFYKLNEGIAEVLRLTMILMPALVFISLYALNTSLLNCERSFFLPSVAPSAVNIVWLFAIFLVRKLPAFQAVEYLAMIIVCAFMIQWGVTLPQVVRYLFKELGEKWQQKRFFCREMMQLIRPFTLGIVGIAATQINSALDAIFARMADSQGPAYLWYALRIQQLPLALIGLGLTGALLPPMARAVQNGDSRQYQHFLYFAIKRTILWLVPITAAIFVLGFSGINLVYGHGEFSQKSTAETTFCLWAYSSALVPMAIVLILASAFYAHKNYQIPTMLSLLSVAINLLLNALFVFVFHWKATSIALATAFSACGNSFCLSVCLRKKYGLPFEGIMSSFFKVLVASFMAMVATLFLGMYFFQDNTFFWITQQDLVLFPRKLSFQLLSFCMQSLCFGITFIAVAYFLSIHEILSFLPRLKKKIQLQSNIVD